MKKATYINEKGNEFTVDYDETAPCKVCSLPVETASMGGTDLCPSCDCGVYRDGTKWETMRMNVIKRNAPFHIKSPIP